MNINELFWVINKGNIDEHFLDIQPNELAVKKKIDVDCDGLNSPLLFESESGIINLKRMIIEAEFWIEKKKITLSRPLKMALIKSWVKGRGLCSSVIEIWIFFPNFPYFA